MKEGKVSMQTLDDRVRDVLRVKFMIALFDRPYIPDAKQTVATVNSQANQQVALRAARESIVLLKNQNNTLPLSKQITSIAVIGPNADDQGLAHYRYGPSVEPAVTVLEGIKKLVGTTVKVNYAKGCDVVDAHWPETEVLPEPLSTEERNQIDAAVAIATPAQGCPSGDRSIETA